MKTITKLSVLIRDMNDESIQQDGAPLTIRRALATCIARSQSPDPIRMIELAHRFWHKTEEDRLTMDDNDFDALKDAILNDRLYTVLIKAPLMQALKDAETPLELKKEETDKDPGSD